MKYIRYRKQNMSDLLLSQ